MHHTINILTDLVFILLHGSIFLFNYVQFSKRLFQPAVLFSLVWWVVILIHFVFKFTLLNELYQLSPEVYLVFFIGVVCFSAGSLLVNYFWQKKGLFVQTVPPQFSDTSFLFRVMVLVVVLAGLPFYINASFQIFIASKADDFFTGLRSELSYGDADIGILKYFMPLAFIAYAFNLYAFSCKRSNINRLLLAITFLALVTYAVFATGRTYFFMILCIYLGVGFLVNPTFSIKKYAALLGFFIVLFMVVGVIYGKGGNTQDTFQDNLQASSEGIGIYMVGSLNALDIELAQKPNPEGNGDNTLRFFTKLAMGVKLLPERKVNSFVQDFVFVPYPTNVFTYYSPYIRDFGKAYAWLMLGLFGALQTWLFNKALYQKSMRYIFYYSYLLAPLMLNFFADQYLTTFSFWLQLFVLTELFLFINKFFVFKKW